MTRIPRLALALALLAPLPLAAQSPKPPDISKQLIGTWEGPYQSEAVPPGSLKLVVERGEKQEWKVTLTVIADQPPPSGDVRDFTVTGSTVSWVQDIADMQCTSTATLVAGVLKGTAECAQGGAVALTATFLLAKKI